MDTVQSLLTVTLLDKRRQKKKCYAPLPPILNKVCKLTQVLNHFRVVGTYLPHFFTLEITRQTNCRQRQ